MIKTVAELSVEKASLVLAKLLRNGARIEVQKVYPADISAVTAEMNSLDSKIIGAYIDLKGDMAFKFLFYVEEKDSLLLTDMLLKKPLGTTKDFGVYTYSTVQEIGNILSSAIAGVFNADFQIRVLPTPPSVVHSFAGTVFGEYIAGAMPDADEILIIESVFKLAEPGLKCRMYVVPYKGSEKILNYLVSAS